MGRTVIEMGLSLRDIDRAIAKIDAYKRDLNLKVAQFQKKLAERIKEYSQTGFNNSRVDDLVNEQYRPAKVDVTVEDGTVTTVVALGEDAIWVEFGAGVFHNGSAGSSPNPNGAKMGYTIGSYGQGKGKRKAWGFLDKSGELHITHGTEATMPMYNAVKQVVEEIYEIAREVFG